MKGLLLLFGYFFLLVTVQSQTPVGKWFHSSAIMETVGGKKTDAMEAFYKKYPCMKTSYYVFQTDKKVVELAPDCSEEVANDLSIGGSTWEMKGKLLHLTFHDDASIAAVYTVEFIDKNTMILKYTDPTATRPESVKSMTMTFKSVTK